jgi:sigma-B regulation protein RsbU (phosphoserine phosphatase)
MENWQRIYNLVPGYLFTFSDDGIIINMNSILLNDLGYEPEEVINNIKIEQLLTPGSSIFFQTHLFPLIKMQGSAKELYLLFKTKSNEKLPVLLNAIVENTDADFVVYCAGMEISNRNQFEKELYEAKNLAEKAQLENKDLIKLKKELQLNQHVLEKQLQQITRFNYEHQQINKVLSHDLQETTAENCIIY